MRPLCSSRNSSSGRIEARRSGAVDELHGPTQRTRRPRTTIFFQNSELRSMENPCAPHRNNQKPESAFTHPFEWPAQDNEQNLSMPFRLKQTLRPPVSCDPRNKSMKVQRPREATCKFIQLLPAELP